MLFCDSLTWFNWFLLALPFVLNPTFLHLDFLTHLFESWLANFLRDVFAPRLLELELNEVTYNNKVDLQYWYNFECCGPIRFIFQIFKYSNWDKLMGKFCENNIFYVGAKTYHFAFCYGFVIAMFLDVAIMQWIAVWVN